MENSNDNTNEIMSPRVRQLAKKVDDIKSSQEVSVKYMRMWEELVDAKKEGEKKHTIKTVRRNLKKGRSLDIISDFLEEKLENIELINSEICENPELDDEEILELIKDRWVEN